MNKISIQIGERLFQIREKLGLNQTFFAKKLNLLTQTYSRYEKGERDLPDSVKIILRESGVNIDWLLTGEGEMFRGETRNVEYMPVAESSKIPLLRQTVSCGPGQEWETGDNVESYIEPLGLVTDKKQLCAFRSRGVSMIGAGIQDGDILIFDGDKNQSLHDDIYVFGFNGEAFCKFLRFDVFAGKIHIYSVHQKDLDKSELIKTVDSSTDGFQIFGRVICWIHENRLMWRG